MNDSDQKERRTRPILWTVILSLTVPLFAGQEARAEFTPLVPCRLLDTRRPGEGPALVGQTTREVMVRGTCGIPEGATAITYNATIVSPQARGYLTLHPAGTDLPTATSVNFVAGDVRGNAGVVKLGAAEPALSAYLATSPQSSTAHLVLDATGYHAGTLVGVAARLLGPDLTPERWIEHGDGTVTDRLTGLQWEMKTDDDSIHDKDDTYSWSSGSPWNPDGTAYSIFLAQLNTAKFAGYDDWRLPTVDELQSLMEGGPDCMPCTTIPGELTGGWSSSTVRSSESVAWLVATEFGFVVQDSKGVSHGVRAVRGGS